MALATEFNKAYFLKLTKYVDNAYLEHAVFPPEKQIFSAFNHCPLPKVSVVILGQDPYHGPKQAHGLAFSVPEGIPVPPSLKNIYKEIESDIGCKTLTSGNLLPWAAQGVLLLNSTLTVTAGIASSHQSLGWETFTDAVIATISEKHEHVVFMLWGTYAQSKRQLIDETKHLILIAPHPSPLSAYRGFFGCKHFSQTNTYLQKQGKKAINW